LLKATTQVVDPDPSFRMWRLWRLWRHECDVEVTWRHRWRHQSTPCRHFHIGSEALNGLVSEIFSNKTDTQTDNKGRLKLSSASQWHDVTMQHRYIDHTIQPSVKTEHQWTECEVILTYRHTRTCQAAGVWWSQDAALLGTASLRHTRTYMSSSGGMMISGRSIARHCIAAAESLLPVLLNIARDATVVIPVTNWVISESLSCEASGTAGTHVFRYLSLQLTDFTDLEVRVRGQTRSSKLLSFNSLPTVSYQHAIVTLSLKFTVLRNSPLKSATIFKLWLGVIHWKWHQLIDHIWLCIHVQ